MSTIYKFAIWVKKQNIIPAVIRRMLLRHMNLMNARTASWIAKNPYANDSSASTYEPQYSFRLGIIKELWHLHYHYIAACKEMRVAYKVLDISSSDWLQVIKDSECDAFLVYPSVVLSVWKQMFDERLRVIAKDLGKIIFPSYDEIWFYESKRRMHYWLSANGVPHPKTWIFYNLQQAITFAGLTELPVVYKSDLGSGASGVEIFYKRHFLMKHIRRCFKRGFTTHRRCRSDKEWGFVILQEYLPNAREWRIVRMGKSYFGYEKLKKGEYHSGSLERRYGPLPQKLLHFAKDVLDIGRFMSMDLDIFETNDGQYLVNELQAMFGMSRPEMCVVDGQAGRMLHQPRSDSWIFEAGDFCRNNLCNHRVKTLLKTLERELKERN